MKRYWAVYSICLLGYLILSIAWIGFGDTMPAAPKVVATICAAIVLIIVAMETAIDISGKWWKMILILLPSLFIWATVVDASIGLIFHKGNIFYMSENTWPDKQMLVIVQNGFMYTIFKVIGIAVTVPLLRYVR